MAISAEMVKELRERTGAGVLDCKNALVETDGDIEQSIKILREKGLAKVAKKAGRVASEGLVSINFSPDYKKAVIVEVNSETDFVAKNDEFKEFVAKLPVIALENAWSDLEDFCNIKYEKDSIKDTLNNMIATIGENMNIRRIQKLESPGAVHVGYIHGGGRIGVVIGLETEADYDSVVTMGKDIAMQVASMSPRFIDESDVDDDYIESEKEILIQQALNEGKPQDIVEKMVVGRLKKELKESCLLEQKFVRNADITVKQYVDDSAKAIGKPIKVSGMVRYEVGEGIEKREQNFAEEVAKQMGS